MLLLSNAVLIAVKAKGNWRLPKQISHFKQWYLKVPRVNENLIALRLLRFVFNSCNLLNMGFWILSFSSVDIVIATYCRFHQLSQFIIAVSNVVNHRTPRQCSNIDDKFVYSFSMLTWICRRGHTINETKTLFWICLLLDMQPMAFVFIRWKLDSAFDLIFLQTCLHSWLWARNLKTCSCHSDKSPSSWIWIGYRLDRWIQIIRHEATKLWRIS